jgi:hypothetical protein
MTALTADLQARIEAYLLGRLSDDEQARIEALMFEHEDVFEAIRDAEDDLIDRYLAGELAQPDCDAFEQVFAISATRKERIAFARMLSQGLTGTPADRAAPPAAAPRHARPSIARRFGIPASAALAAAIAIAWLATRRDPAVAPSETVATFALDRTELRRGAGSLPRLPLPRGTTAIRLQPELEAPPLAADYAVTLRRVEGPVVWQGTVRADEGGRFSVLVPAQLVGSGDYVLSLATPGTAPEDRVEYPFRVVARD